MRSHVPLRAQLVAILALLVGFLGLGVGPASAYYEESHLTSDEVRITVDSVGVARVEHTLAWRIVAGKPRNIDLLGTEPSAIPDPATTLECEDGRMLNASVAVLPGKGVRVTVLEPKGLHLRAALPAEGCLHGQPRRRFSEPHARDGPELPPCVERRRPPQEGYERPRVTFFLPPTLEATRCAGRGRRDARRWGERDPPPLARARRARAASRPGTSGALEETTWAVRIGAKAFDAGRSAAFGPPHSSRCSPRTRCRAATAAAAAYGVVRYLPRGPS